MDYEELYINELMRIEEEQRQIILRAFLIGEKIEEHEQATRGKIVKEKNEEKMIRDLCVEFVQQISYINSIANYEGQGRDDLQYEILEHAKGLLNTVSIS